MIKKLFRFISYCFLLSLPFCFAGCGEVGKSAVDEPAATLVSAPENDAAEPSVASAPDGTIYVAWVEHLPEKRGDLFVRRFDGDGKPVSEAVRVNPEAGTATAWRGDQPAIKVGPDGTIYVGWTARVPVAKGSATDLCLSVSRDGGKTFDAPAKVNDDTVPASHGMHSLEIDKNGRVFMAWLDERYLKNEANQPPPVNTSNGNSAEMQHQHAEPNSEVYFAVSNDGGKTFSANKKIAGNICPCCKTSIITAPDGKIYIAWRQVLDGDYRHIAVSSSIDGGNSFTAPNVVSDDGWQISACPVSGAGLAVDAENDLQIVWYTAGESGTPGVYKTESKDGGRTFAPRVLVSGDAAGGTPLFLKDVNGDARIVFSAVDKSAHFFKATKGSGNFTEENRIAEAELPGAALSKGKMYVAFVRNESQKRKIFLIKRD